MIKEKKYLLTKYFLLSTDGETRTLMNYSLEPKSSASTNFATPGDFFSLLNFLIKNKQKTIREKTKKIFYFGN